MLNFDQESWFIDCNQCSHQSKLNRPFYHDHFVSHVKNLHLNLLSQCILDDSVRHALQVIGVVRTVGVANCYRKTLCKNRNNEGS